VTQMKQVLVVDDDPDVGVALRAKLEGAQRYSVLVATGGEEALRIAQSERPDLMLCDIDMPGMDGVAISEAMAANDATKRIPLIFLSALVTPADERRGVTAGTHLMLSKHTPVQDLIARIEKAIGQP